MTKSIKVVKKKQRPATNKVKSDSVNRWSKSFQSWVHSFRERDRTAVLPAFDSLFKEEPPDSMVRSPDNRNELIESNTGENST